MMEWLFKKLLAVVLFSSLVRCVPVDTPEEELFSFQPDNLGVVLGAKPPDAGFAAFFAKHKVKDENFRGDRQDMFDFNTALFPKLGDAKTILSTLLNLESGRFIYTSAVPNFKCMDQMTSQKDLAPHTFTAMTQAGIKTRQFHSEQGMQFLAESDQRNSKGTSNPFSETTVSSFGLRDSEGQEVASCSPTKPSNRLNAACTTDLKILGSRDTFEGKRLTQIQRKFGKTELEKVSYKPRSKVEPSSGSKGSPSGAKTPPKDQDRPVTPPPGKSGSSGSAKITPEKQGGSSAGEKHPISQPSTPNKPPAKKPKPHPKREDTAHKTGLPSVASFFRDVESEEGKRSTPMRMVHFIA